MEQLTIKHLGRRLAYMPYVEEYYQHSFFNLDYENIGYVKENQCKLLLHPLFDLTKEITHKGEKFEPFDYFYDDPERDWFAGNVFMNYLFEGNIDKIDFNFIPYYVIEKLLEWHFHIDEPEGTWIDVNTLPKNPYE